MQQLIIRQLLEALRSEGGDPPGKQFLRSADVIRRALDKAGELCAASSRSLTDERHEMPASVLRYSLALAELVLGDERLVEGEGNFGSSHPAGEQFPAHPRFTRCRITARGLRRLAEQTEPGAAEPGGR